MDLSSKFGSASRQEIDQLLAGKLSDALDETQKQKKIGNLPSNLRRAKQIRNAGLLDRARRHLGCLQNKRRINRLVAE